MREELGRERDRALADPETAAELRQARRAIEILKAQSQERDPRPRYTRELRAIRAIFHQIPSRRIRRLLVQCRGDVGRVLAILRKKLE